MLTNTSVIRVRRQKGVGLIEVLVALLVLTIGVLGMVALQTRALQFNQESLYTSQALMMAYEMTDRIRANRGNEGEYLVDYGTAVNAANDCSNGTCTPEQMADYDTSEWKDALAANLPFGDGEIAVDNTGPRPLYTISVRFTDQRIDAALNGGTAGDSTREVQVRTEI